MPTDRDRGLAEVGERVVAAGELRAGLLPRGVEVAHERSEQHDHDRGRDDLPQRARGRDHAGWQARGSSCSGASWAGPEGPWSPRWRPTMPVEAARKAPTITMDTARPPGSGPKTRAMVVSSSSGDLGAFQRDAHQDEHQNGQKRLDGLARNHALVHAVDDEGDVAAPSPLPSRRETTVPRCVAIPGIGRRISTLGSPLRPPSAEYSTEPVSMAWWISSPAESSAAMIANEIMPAPAMANATGKPVMIPAKQRQEHDDQAYLDPIQSEQHGSSFPSLRRVSCVPSVPNSPVFGPLRLNRNGWRCSRSSASSPPSCRDRDTCSRSLHPRPIRR